MFDIFRLETRKIVTNDWFAFVVSWNKSDKEKKKDFFHVCCKLKKNCSSCTAIK